MVDFLSSFFFFNFYLCLPSMFLLDQVHHPFPFLSLLYWFLFLFSTLSSPLLFSFYTLPGVRFIALRVQLPAVGPWLLDLRFLLSPNLLISSSAHPAACWAAPHGHPFVLSNLNTQNEMYCLPCSNLLIFLDSLCPRCDYHLGAKTVSCP